MKAVIEICRHGVYFDVEVTGTFVAAVRGHRDRYGVPEEPDEPAYIDDIQAVTVEEVLWDDDQGSTMRLFLKGEVVELTEEEDKEASNALLASMPNEGPEPYFDELPDDFEK